MLKVWWALAALLGIVTVDRVQWGAGECEIVVHELTPGDDHDGSSVLMETLVGMDGPGYDTGQWKIVTSDRDTWSVDSVSKQGSDNPLEGCHRGSPGGILQVVAETVHSSVLSWTALNARQEWRADFTNQRAGCVDLRESLLDLLVGQTVTRKEG